MRRFGTKVATPKPVHLACQIQTHKTAKAKTLDSCNLCYESRNCNYNSGLKIRQIVVKTPKPKEPKLESLIRVQFWERYFGAVTLRNPIVLTLIYLYLYVIVIIFRIRYYNIPPD